MKDKKEIWKDIPNFEGSYQVSNLGNLRSLDRTVVYCNGVERFYKGRLLKGYVDSRGYRQTAISIGGKGRNYKYAQLVAMAFLGHKPDGLTLVVDHINGIRDDDRVENLRIVTNRQNTSTCFRADKGSLSSIYVGVSWYNSHSKWVARVQYNGSYISLGCFHDEVEASNAYQNALKKINNGSFNPEDYKPKYSSKYKGVSLNKETSKWAAYINIDGARKYLGCFDTEEEAHYAYQEAFRNKI